MNSHVWQPILPALAQRAQVITIDLPGHGANRHLSLGTLENAVGQLIPHIPPDAIILGWSLGGLIAQALAYALPERVSALILVASTPKFVAGASWGHGLPEATLAGFAQNLQQDYAATVKRFFALQFLGVKADARQVNALRESIMAHPANLQALEDGLDILRTADFSHLPAKQPTQWLLGRLDKLIPASLADVLPEMGYKQVAMLGSAAHVPFVTHPELFMEHIGAFLDAH
jgi:pimeloyl-[acyl-carrier protein] methyl ester esterase